MKSVISIFAFLAALCLGLSARGEEHLLGPDRDPMHLPSGAIILPDGRWVVLDGARCRLAFFEASGAFIRYQGREGNGETDFMHPLGIAGGQGGEIIVADTGNDCLKLLDPSGSFLGSVRMNGIHPPPRLTGVAWDRQGERIYVTDARNHAVHVLRLPDYEVVDTIPLAVTPPEQTAFPCAPTWHDGVLYVVEPLNGRVRCIVPGESSQRFIGTYGLGRGRLYRPKGVALDREGRVYVSDSFQGTLSVFDPSGDFLGLVDPSGKGAHRFDTPFGLVLDGEGGLGLVEMGAHRVSRIRAPLAGIEGPKSIEQPSGEEGRRHRIDEQPRAQERSEPGCTICHPEWLLSGTPVDSKSHAGTAAMCLSCHDGPVADSRHSAFALHSHLEGGKGVFGRMDLQDIPLGPDGTMACMTCHMAHGDSFEDHDMARTIFLRFPGPKGKVCRICHPSTSEAAFSHYMGPVNGAMPERLVRQGAAAPQGRSALLECRTCHLPHGDKDRFLLVGGQSGPCVLCHDGVRHEEEPHAETGLFSCRDCHRIHDSRQPGLLQERPGGTASRCGACHFEAAKVNDSSHAPTREGEACLSCHAPFALPASGLLLWGPASGPGRTESERRCRSCHVSDNAFAAQPVLIADHPGGKVPSEPEIGIKAVMEEVSCSTCHDPHLPDPAMLKAEIVERRCASCHGPEGLWLFLNFHQEKRSFPL